MTTTVLRPLTTRTSQSKRNVKEYMLYLFEYMGTAPPCRFVRIVSKVMFLARIVSSSVTYISIHTRHLPRPRHRSNSIVVKSCSEKMLAAHPQYKGAKGRGPGEARERPGREKKNVVKGKTGSFVLVAKSNGNGLGVS